MFKGVILILILGSTLGNLIDDRRAEITPFQALRATEALSVQPCVDPAIQCSAHGLCMTSPATPTADGFCSCIQGFITSTFASNNTYCDYKAKGKKTAILLAAIPFTGIMFGGGYWHLDQWKWMAISTAVFWGGLFMFCCISLFFYKAETRDVDALMGCCYLFAYMATNIGLWARQLDQIVNSKISDGDGQPMVDIW